jgi:DNA-directed RNA polymerase specialized sigma24 family protein
MPFDRWSRASDSRPTQDVDVTAWVHREVCRAARKRLSPSEWRQWTGSGRLDDAAQNVLVQLLSEPFVVKTFEFEPPLRAYVWRCTKNQLRTGWRDRQRQYPEPTPDDASEPMPFEATIQARSCEPGDQAAASELRRKELAVLRAMPRDANHVVLALVLLGKDKPWICAYLGINDNTCHVRKCKGLDALRSHWTATHGESDWLAYRRTLVARGLVRNDIKNSEDNL